MTYILIIFTFISCAMYMYFYTRVSKKRIFLFKVVTSFFFFQLALYLFLKNEVTNYTSLIITGISFGFIGDVILGLRGLCPSKKHMLFVLGILSFLIGHISYIISQFIFFKSNIIYLIIITILFLISTIYITKKSKVDFGKSVLIDYLYIAVSSLFVATTILNFITYLTTSYLLVMIGSISFVTSDFILSYLYFSDVKAERRNVLKLINIATYYIGQIILALSIALL